MECEGKDGAEERCAAVALRNMPAWPLTTGMSISIDLSNRLAIVTGAAGGLGLGISKALLDAGARVVLVDQDRKRLQSETKTFSKGTIRLPLDITNEDAVKSSFERLSRETGAADILVNNAGVGGRVGMPFTRLDAKDWQPAWHVNVVGLFNVTKAIVGHMIERRQGAIVNIASVSGRTGFQTSPPYSATKAAVINFTQVMARDLAPHGVRVNAICPGMVFTPFYRAQRLASAEADPALLQVSDEEYFENKAKRLIPLQRGQTPADIAYAVCFLASDLAASITGQSLNVDGGLVMS
jgi:NAD(P)-dependent dehydrogenase (short-subunit alcohol dehydrogenase family)